MPSSKRSNNHKTEEEEEEETEPTEKSGSDSGSLAATFVFGALAGAVALWLVETFDANERKRKDNVKRSE
jgi:F0F1-type ATP synthase assembly protein I